MSARRFLLALSMLVVLVTILPYQAQAAERSDAQLNRYAQLPDDQPFVDRSPPSGNDMTTLDSDGVVGIFTSATIGADGFALISYTDATNKDLKVAHCTNTACTEATLTTLDSTGNVGSYTSITIGQDGLGLIAYYDLSNANLKVAHCDDIVCSTATLATLDATGDVGKHTSITIGADGFALISYFDATNKDLKVAHCEDVTCSAATTATVASQGIVGEYSSITLGANGLAILSFYGNANITDGTLFIARCTDIPCSSVTTTATNFTSLREYSGRFSSITIGDDGLPVVSFWDAANRGDLRVVHCADTVCSQMSGIGTDSTGNLNVGTYSSVSIGSNQYPAASYYDMITGDLKIGFCITPSCTGSSSNTIYSPLRSVTLDSTGNVGMYTSLTIGTDGNPLVAYHDATNGDLKVVHCSNPFCTPFFRRR